MQVFHHRKNLVFAFLVLVCQSKVTLNICYGREVIVDRSDQLLNLVFILQYETIFVAKYHS